MLASNVVWDGALSRYRIYGSQMPKAFTEKRLQFPADVAAQTASVFVDILRATTTLTSLSAAGCLGTYVDVKPTRGDYPFVPPQGFDDVTPWVYGGELNGAPVSGVDSNGAVVGGVVGNSPISVVPGSFDGQYLRFFSTNGSRALLALIGAGLASARAMCFANVRATVNALLHDNPKRIWLTCGGFYGGAALEDTVACGLAVSMLLDDGYATEDQLDDEAATMLLIARFFMADGHIDNERLVARLGELSVGSLMKQIGHAEDIAASIYGLGMQGDLWQRMSDFSLELSAMTAPFLVQRLSDQCPK